MKKLLVMLLIAALLGACADTDFRSGMLLAYPSLIGDSQGLISFDPQQLEYAATTSEPSYTIWASMAEPGTIAIGSLSASGATVLTNVLMLTNGLNPIVLTFSRSGFVSMQYTVDIMYYNPQHDTRLQNIVVDAQSSLLPSFVDNVQSYKVFNTNTSIDITATTAVTNASFTINGVSVASGILHTVSGLVADSSNYVDIQVVSGSGEYTNHYGIAVIPPVQYPAGVNLTTNNYAFSGGIQAVRDLITGTVTLNNVIEGVVTAINSPKEVWLQDNTAGILVYDLGETLYSQVSVGDRIQLTCLGGKIYSNLKEVTSFSTVTPVSSGNSIYYRTGPINSTHVGQYWRTPMYSTTVQIGGTENYDIAGWGQMRVIPVVPAGIYYFTGPVSIYSSTVQMMVY